MSNEVGIKMLELMKAINFDIEVDILTLLKAREREELKDILSDPNMMFLFYFNDFYISYQRTSPAMIIQKLKLISSFVKGRVNKEEVGYSINEELYFDLIQDNKNNENLISEFYIEKIGAWVEEDFFNKLIEDILLFDKNMTYIEIFSDTKFIAHLMKKYVRYQLKYKNLDKKFYLYELNVMFEQLKDNIDKNIEDFLKNKKMFIFTDQSIYEKYCIKRHNYNKEYILDNESIYNFIEAKDLDLMYKIVPKYYYYTFIKEDKLDFVVDKTIYYVYSLIEENIKSLNKLSPAHLSSLKMFL